MKNPKVIKTEANPLEEQVQTLENQLKKALSDYNNLQREQEKEKQVLLDSVRRSIFRDLIDLFTDLNIAVTKAKDAAGENPWLAGIVQIMQKYNDLLKNNGITEFTFNPGDPIDYNRIQIIGTLPQGTPNTIAQTAEPGYQTGEYIITPAKVIVNTGAQEQNSNSKNQKDQKAKDTAEEASKDPENKDIHEEDG